MKRIERYYKMREIISLWKENGGGDGHAFPKYRHCVQEINWRITGAKLILNKCPECYKETIREYIGMLSGYAQIINKLSNNEKNVVMNKIGFYQTPQGKVFKRLVSSSVIAAETEENFENLFREPKQMKLVREDIAKFLFDLDHWVNGGQQKLLTSLKNYKNRIGHNIDRLGGASVRNYNVNKGLHDIELLDGFIEGVEQTELPTYGIFISLFLADRSLIATDPAFTNAILNAFRLNLENWVGAEVFDPVANTECFLIEVEKYDKVRAECIRVISEVIEDRYEKVDHIKGQDNGTSAAIEGLYKEQIKRMELLLDRIESNDVRVGEGIPNYDLSIWAWGF